MNARRGIPLPGLIGLLVVLSLLVGYAFNFFIGIAILVIGFAMLISRGIQERQPREPGE
jgi:uncharacterized membrane protein (Fun14 family)